MNYQKLDAEQNQYVDADLDGRSDEVYRLADGYLGLSTTEGLEMARRIQRRRRAQTARWRPLPATGNGHPKSTTHAGDGAGHQHSPAVARGGDGAAHQHSPAVARGGDGAADALQIAHMPANNGKAHRATPGAGYQEEAPARKSAAFSDRYHLVGKTLGKYRIIEVLDVGGMGVVYRAEDIRLQRPVAIKLLPASQRSDDTARQRFLCEAKAVAMLDHPNICTIYDIDEAEGKLFIVMALYDGETLEKRLQDGALDMDDVFRIGLQLANGLSFVHSRGVIHRDIKPSNVLIVGDCIVKIIDFGISRIEGLTALTTSGKTMGTPIYMSPEQIKGEAADHRADIWALGVILYEALTGFRPFRGDVPPAIMYSVLNEAPPSISEHRPDASRELIDIVMKCIEKDREDRYSDASEIVRDLRVAMTVGGQHRAPTSREQHSTTSVFRHYLQRLA